MGIFRFGNSYAQDGLVTRHGAHFRDPAFRATYERGVRASHGVDPGFEWRIHAALWAAQTSLRVDGDFVECGVNAGFVSSAIMQKLDWNAVGRHFYLIDTFAGPALEQFSEGEIQKERDVIARRAIQAGAYVTDMERIQKNFAEWRNAMVVRRAVPEVLAQVPFGRVAFLHLDMNCALPETSVLEFFWERLTAGGIVLLDDYACAGHECQRDAIDAVAAARGVSVLSLPTGQGLIIR